MTTKRPFSGRFLTLLENKSEELGSPLFLRFSIQRVEACIVGPEKRVIRRYRMPHGASLRRRSGPH